MLQLYMLKKRSLHLSLHSDDSAQFIATQSVSVLQKWIGGTNNGTYEQRNLTLKRINHFFFSVHLFVS